MKKRRLLIAMVAMILAASTSFAQGRVDIGIYHNGDGQLEVKVRPQADFTGIFSSLVFTIRWDKSSNATLGQPTQDETVADYLSLMRSGGVHDAGTYFYQVYAGFGFSRIGETKAWEAGKEYTIATIPVTGAGEFHLVNDPWTREVANNGDFYVSLGGVDQTGVIYKSLAAPASLESTLLIQPNPNDGRFTFSFLSAEAGDIRIEMLNSLGQRVFGDQLRDFQGTYRKEMDLTAMSNGIYYLKITRGGETSVHKVVYR
ncbi:MAG: T9SS type A sorting domain-containing protein [Flavobacteriales bacterium]|nr:T9SS type A sorting domain-containing protein [Flavobacteriales bacterium]